MSINMNDALQMLEQNNGISYVPVFMPSLQKEVNFRPLTVGKIKSISKMFLENENISDIGIILTSIMLDLCTEQLPLNDITEIDRLRALLELRRYNNLSENIFKIKCSNKKCDAEMNYKVDIGEVLNKFTEIPKPIKKEFTHNDIKFEIEFGLPSVNLIIKYKQFIENTKEVLMTNTKDFSQEDLFKIELYLLKYSTLLYICNIKINGSDIEGFVDSSIVNRNNIIDRLPPHILDFIKEHIVESKKYDIPDIVKEEGICHKCNEGKMIINIDIDDFFLI